MSGHEAIYQIGHLFSILYWLGLSEPEVDMIARSVIRMMRGKIERYEAMRTEPPLGPENG